MRGMFDMGFAMGPMAVPVKWRQDKAPHAEGSFNANVLHGETQSESAGPTRGGVAADPWTVFVRRDVALCARIAVGDTLELTDGTVLDVQQISTDLHLGWVIRATANMRAPR